MSITQSGAPIPPPPVAHLPFAATPLGAQARMMRSVSKTGKHIMVIDDEPDIHRFFRDFLATEGHRVTCASGWREAVRNLAVSTPDLIILDILMPEVNGFIIAETLKKELGWSVPVLIYSALNRPQDILTGFSKGSNVFLCKPASIHHLRAAISHLLNEAAREMTPLPDRQDYDQSAAH